MGDHVEIQELKGRLRLEAVIAARYGPLQRDGNELRPEQHDSLKIDAERQVWNWWSRQRSDGKPHGGDVIAFLAFERFGESQMSALTDEQLREVFDEARAAAGTMPAAVKVAKASAPRRPRRRRGKYFATIEEFEAWFTAWQRREGGTLYRWMRVQGGVQSEETAWPYYLRRPNDKAWSPAIRVYRVDYDGRRPKMIFPVRRIRTGWRVGLGAWGRRLKCPLYHLPELEAALQRGAAGQRLHITEGEKCVEALAAAGLLAVTSQGGSARAQETDWAPVRRWLDAGGDVVFWQDCDSAGDAYRDAVCRAIRGRVLFVDLREYGLQEGQDVADLAEEMALEGHDAAAQRATLEDIIERHARPWINPDAEVTLEFQQHAPLPAAPAWTGHAAKKPKLANFIWRTRWAPDKAKAKGGDISELKALKDLSADLEARKFKRDDDSDKAKRFEELTSKYNAHERRELLAKPIEQVAGELQKALNGWPHRIASRGAKPLLFADDGGDDVKLYNEAKKFNVLLKAYAQPQFNGGQDDERSNYVTMEDLYYHAGQADTVQEWRQVELAPHWPPYPDHYYCYRLPKDYKPKGERLAEFLSFFDNLRDEVSRAIVAAAAVTPFWGGPYGKKPLFAFDADVPGSGKSTVAFKIAYLANPHRGGLALQLDQRAVERIVERMLSPEGRVKPVIVIDNVKKQLDNALLEWLVTADWISGKELAVGEGSCPNTKTYFVTANAGEVSGDMASRTFYASFKPLSAKQNEDREQWESKIEKYLQDHRDEIVADCLALLQREVRVDWGDSKGERATPWISHVLARVIAHPAVKAVVGDVALADVLRANQAVRDGANVDLQDAIKFRLGMLERICTWKGYDKSVARPAEDIFVRTEAPPKGDDEDYGDREKHHNMVAYFKQIFSRSQYSAKSVAGKLDRWIKAGYLRGVRQHRTATRRGWLVEAHAITQYLESVFDASQASQASLPDMGE